jgi:hypothetical protein
VEVRKCLDSRRALVAELKRDGFIRAACEMPPIGRASLHRIAKLSYSCLLLS